MGFSLIKPTIWEVPAIYGHPHIYWSTAQEPTSVVDSSLCQASVRGYLRPNRWDRDGSQATWRGRHWLRESLRFIGSYSKSHHGTWECSATLYSVYPLYAMCMKNAFVKRTKAPFCVLCDISGLHVVEIPQFIHRVVNLLSYRLIVGYKFYCKCESVIWQGNDSRIVHFSGCRLRHAVGSTIDPSCSWLQKQCYRNHDLCWSKFHPLVPQVGFQLAWLLYLVMKYLKLKHTDINIDGWIAMAEHNPSFT